MIKLESESVLLNNHSSLKRVFELKDSSIKGEVILISNPRKWQDLEDEHLASKLVIPAKAGIYNP
jgi:hypothetical protein